MNEFRILEASVQDDLEYWIRLWNRCSTNELFSHPYYCRMFVNKFEHLICVVKETTNTIVMFPLIIRPLSKIPWIDHNFKDYCDLITPHGYSGPFLWGEPLVGDFWIKFDDWAKRNLVVSIYARLSLFPYELLSANQYLETRDVGNNIVRSLKLSNDEIWADYEHKVRKNVKKARRNGIEIEIDSSGKRLIEFMEIYKSTMNRRNASEYYNFDEPFFRKLIEYFKKNIVFIHALQGDRVISTEMVLISAKHIYSFLGGTLPESFEFRPNDLIKHTIIEYGKELGKDDFILGGGFSGGSKDLEDGIFKYKKSFAPNGVVPYRVASRICNQKIYTEVMKLRHELEAIKGEKWVPNPDFFPCYRS